MWIVQAGEELRIRELSDCEACGGRRESEQYTHKPRLDYERWSTDVNIYPVIAQPERKSQSQETTIIALLKS